MTRRHVGELNPLVWPSFDAGALPKQLRKAFGARRQSIEMTQCVHRSSRSRRKPVFIAVSFTGCSNAAWLPTRTDGGSHSAANDVTGVRVLLDAIVGGGSAWWSSKPRRPGAGAGRLPAAERPAGRGGQAALHASSLAAGGLGQDRFDRCLLLWRTMPKRWQPRPTRLACCSCR